MSRAKLPSKPADRTPPPDYPEYAVRHDAFDRFFEKPLPTSTFHDLVSQGVIVQIKALRGFYKLNESLCRLGLRPVMKLPEELRTRTTEEIIRLAFHAINPEVFPAPAWLLDAEVIDGADASHAELLVEKHSTEIAEFASDREKHAYLQGVLDASLMLETDRQSGTAEN